MEPLDALKAILANSGRPKPEATKALTEALSKPPEPGPKPRPPKTLADILQDGRATTSAPPVDLMAYLAKPPAVKIMPDAPSPFAGIGRGNTNGNGKSPFAGITHAGPKPRKKPGWKEDPEKRAPVEKLSLLLMQELEEKGIEYPNRGNSSVADAHFRAGVQESFELERIVKIDRRPSNFEQYEDQTDLYKRPEGTMRLWPIQSAVLVEAARAGGLLGPIGVGHGKTLASLLVGEAMRAKKIVLLVPPQLRNQLLQHDIPQLNKHFRLPLERLRVIAYSELSNARTAELLEELAPDLIVSDECHLLRHPQSSRTKRFLRYMKDHPECLFVGLSGTITRRSLRDYQHLSELALRKNSPLPNHHPTLMDWAMALDVTKKDPMPPGALLKLCTPDELEKITKTPDPHHAQSYVRQAFRRRLVETPGVVATSESALGTSLVIRGLRPSVPAEVQVAIDHLHMKWEIGEEELVDAMSVARVGRQLAGGFYYRWIWPDGKKDFEWLEARAAWNKEVRDILKRSRRGLDSPLLITNAVLRGDFVSGTYDAWAQVKDRYKPTPPVEAVWISKFLVEEALRWGKETCHKTEPGIIWYESDAFGREVAQMGNLPFFGPGMKASAEITRVNVKETPVIVCSRMAHGTGKNLQKFCRNLFTAPSPGGVDWEQTIARTHRPGQEADDVFVDVFLHTGDMEAAYLSALRDAKYIEHTQGQKQKLTYARKVNCGEDD